MTDFIPYGRHHIDQSDIDAIVEVLHGGLLTQGPVVELFEQAVAEYVGAKYAVAVSSGTAALHLAALASGIGPGQALVTSPITFVASANAALYASAQPGFADIDPDSVNLSAEGLEQVLEQNSNTRVVIPVHFAGLPCDMPAIKKAAGQSEITLIEDASHALGSSYPSGERVGSCCYSEMTVFSYHPVKAIAAGEGGMVTTNDEHLHRDLLRLRSHGINKLDDHLEMPNQSAYDGIKFPWYYEMQELGFNYRITDIQCALALSQVKKLDRFVARRRELVKQYDEQFTQLEHCRPAQLDGIEQSAHHLYVLRIDYESAGIRREQLMLELRARNIGTQVHYIPVTMQPYYQRLGFNPEDYPQAQQYYREALSIPLYYDLTDEQQRYVVDTFRELLS